MKKSELKSLIKEVVKHCVREAGPQYKVVGRKSQLEEPGKRNKAREMQDDPEINEVAPPGGEDVMGTIGGAQQEDEAGEVRLIKQVAVGILKLLQMHADEEPEDSVEKPEAPPFPPAKKKPTDKSPEKSEAPKKDDDEEKVDENHKVQTRSYKTVQDLPNNPKNVRDPKVPEM